MSARGGFSVYDDLGSAFKRTMVTRGFASSPVVGLPQGVSVFIDGIPVNEPDAGQVNFDLIPAAMIDRIELLGGTASLLGPNSLGGAVNLITQRAHVATGDIELSVGSNDRVGFSASSGGASGSFTYLAGAEHDREDGWRDLTAGRQTSLFVRLGHWHERRGFSLLAFGARSRAETAGSLPRSVYASRPDSNLSAGDFEDLEQLHMALSAYSGTARGRVSASLWARAHDAERFNVNQADDPDVRGFSRNRTVGASGDWTISKSVGAGVLGVRAGWSFALNDVGIRIFGERIDPGLTTDVKSPIRKIEAHVSTDFRAGPLTLAAGARFDRIRVPFGNRLRPDRDTVSLYRQLSPRAGITIATRRDTEIYASVGRSFRAPAVIELACADPEEPCPLPFALGDDPPLDPVVATTIEAGLRSSRGILSADAAIYRTSVRDDIFLFPYRDENEPEGSTIDGFFANIPRTRREGVELGARLESPRARLHATYTFTRATFETAGLEIFSIRESESGNEIEAGDRLPLVPDHTLAMGGTVSLPGGFTAGADVIAVGERVLRGDEANEESPLPGFVRTDVSVGYERGRWHTRLIATNVFDREYPVFGTFNINQGAGRVVERFLTPAEPRALLVTIGWKH
jgi:outer membrane receptor protein involved in Fe transport